MNSKAEPLWWWAGPVALGALYGISDEFHQIFVPERTAEIADAVCDFFGSAAGAAVYNNRFKAIA